MLTLLLCSSCALFERRNNEDAVVSIGSTVLTQEQLDAATFAATDSLDSVRLADSYIRQWAGDVLFYEKATRDKSPDIEARVEQYRRDLYLYEYEQKLVSQRMNKTVAPQEIEAFYKAHEPMFVLDEPILKGVLVVVPNGTPDMPKLRKWLTKHSEEIENIEKYAYNYGTGYELFTDRWMTAGQLCRHIPVAQQDLATQLRHKQLIEVQDTLQTYFLQVTDKSLAGEPMPVDYAEPKIRQIILRERQAAFIGEQKALLYREADRLFRIKRADSE